MSEDTKRMADRVKRFSAQRRAKSIFLGRFRANVHHHPWTLALALLLIAALCWAMTWVTIPFPGGNSNPLLIALYNVSIKFTAILVSFLLILAFFTSPPKRALEYEASLVQIGFVDRSEEKNPPALVSRERIKHSKKERIIFYSAGLGLKQWIQEREAIESALNVVYVEEPRQVYNKSYYIMLTVVPGVGGPRKGPLYDDEF